MMGCFECGKNIDLHDCLMIIDSKCIREWNWIREFDSIPVSSMDLELYIIERHPKFFHRKCLLETAGERYVT